MQGTGVHYYKYLYAAKNAWHFDEETCSVLLQDRMRRKAISLEASLNKIINRYKHVDSQGE